MLPVTGASVSTLGSFLGSQTVSATDTASAWLDELQFDLGEGPCWDALRLARPVLEPNLRGRRGPERWPAFGRAVQEREIASIFAFPLAVGSLRFGAVDLYSRSPLRFDEKQTQQASALASAVARRVLRQSLAELDVSDESALSPFSRRRVHQATGVVLAQLDVAAEDARMLLQSHAFATDRSVMAVADDVVEGRLTFTKDAGAIEVDSWRPSIARSIF
ncbi:GAF and ANTAR domain-containing protein [Microbacterium aurantiacum]|uniref:GAF and ANTAR domain-containing protein n=1 Tax=Microbacterium aurantiacum TaxID=162393 RepID=UPI000C807CB0|nr:GAF and ANTAR domain-containing protein [Microbacterium aurantiacum]